MKKKMLLGICVFFIYLESFIFFDFSIYIVWLCFLSRYHNAFCVVVGESYKVFHGFHVVVTGTEKLFIFWVLVKLCDASKTVVHFSLVVFFLLVIFRVIFVR